MNAKQAYFVLRGKYDLIGIADWNPFMQIQFIADYERLRYEVGEAQKSKEEGIALDNLIKNELGSDIFSRLSSVESISNPLKDSA